MSLNKLKFLLINFTYIKHLMEIISLGSNCAVCYHLIELNLRNCAYPFDWTKLSIANLNQVLSNQFAGFTELVVKKIF